MGRNPIFKTGAMTPTEYQRRWRAKVRKQKELAPKLAKLRAKQQRRAEREAFLGQRIARASALGEKLYGVVYMDPASRFIVWSRETGLDRAADNHYPTEFWDAIAARPPPAYKDAILFCWSTRPQLANTIRVVEDRWGFEYKMCFGWDKELPGTGYWRSTFGNCCWCSRAATRWHRPLAPRIWRSTGSGAAATARSPSISPRCDRRSAPCLQAMQQRHDRSRRTRWRRLDTSHGSCGRASYR
jgi:hypothetical protein